jgi:predicted Fe-Mo cluster-binding NifX family protein
MKIAISCVGDSLESKVDPRFGRCRSFIIYDDETRGFEVLENGGQYASGGAGSQAAETISNSGAEVVLTGNIGPKAYRALNAAGLSVFLEACGTILEAIEDYREGNLKSSIGPTVSSHSGME